MIILTPRCVEMHFLQISINCVHGTHFVIGWGGWSPWAILANSQEAAGPAWSPHGWFYEALEVRLVCQGVMSTYIWVTRRSTG